MKQIFGVILVVFWTLTFHAQPTLDRLQKVGELQEFEFIEWAGHYNRIVPVKISVNLKNKTEAYGHVEYAENKFKSELLGDIVGNDITLYEYDEYHMIIGTFKGKLNNNHTNWIKSDTDGSDYMSISNASHENDELILYQCSDEKEELFIRPNHKSFVIGDHYDDLKWASFDCIKKDCYEEHPKIKTHNTLEFMWAKLEQNITIGTMNYRPAEKISYAFDSYYDMQSYYGFIYPILSDKEFDTWVRSKVKTARELFNTYSNNEEDENKQFVHGDFFLTALSKKIISGYLYYSGNMSNNVVTIPFIFDRNKSKFYKINDLLRSDFDYAFFLDQYLGKIKRGRMIKEEKQIQSVLKKEHFKHYVLSSTGILFFTDFNTLFGRRSIVVTYTELEGFINNKSVNTFIKKKA